MVGSISQQPSVGNERLSECVVNIYRKLSRPEFQQEILDLPENVAAKKQHWKEYKAKRWRTRVRYFGRYIAADSRLRDPEYAKLSSTHQFVSLTRKLEIRDEDEVWIVVGPLRDYLTKRFEYFRGNTHVYLDLEISGWIPNRLTEEQDDKSFYLPFSHWSGGEDDRGNKYKYNRLEKLTTLVLVWESLGIGFDLSPSGPLTNEVGMSFAYHIYKIRDLANDNKIDVPILELWLDSLDREALQGGDSNQRTAAGVPAEYRDGGKPDGEPLTVAYVSKPETYNLFGPFLSKQSPKLKTIKLGRSLVYLFTDIARLSAVKTLAENEGH